MRVTMRDVRIDHVKEYATDRVYRNSEYANAIPYIESAYLEAIRDNLTYDCKTNTMRDKRLGVLSRPVGEWTEATKEDAILYMSRDIWCNAIRKRNLAIR
jgi:hypothetical protein